MPTDERPYELSEGLPQERNFASLRAACPPSLSEDFALAYMSAVLDSARKGKITFR